MFKKIANLGIAYRNSGVHSLLNGCELFELNDLKMIDHQDVTQAVLQVELRQKQVCHLVFKWHDLCRTPLINDCNEVVVGVLFSCRYKRTTRTCTATHHRRHSALTDCVS